MKPSLVRPLPRPANLRLKLLGAAAVATAILSGPIQAQTTRNWDAVVTAAGTFNWGDAVNWSGDILPDINDIANFSPAPSALIQVDLGATTRTVGSLVFSANGSSNYQLQNGTIVTNSLSQTNDDGNVFLPTALLITKNGGADVLNANITSNTLQLQGQVTAGGIVKTGGATLRLGTSGTNFNNVINGDITILGGTLTAAAGATPGSHNPLGGTGDVVIGAPNVTLSLTANGSIATGVDYDFVRNIRAGNNNFTLDVRLAGGTDTTDPNMRAGTLTIGNATMTVNQANGFRAALDGITILTGATNTRLQLNALTFVDGLTGDAASNIWKRGGSDLEIRGNNEATFAGDVFLGESNTRFVSTGAGLNPMGGTDSTVVFSNGYGLNAIAGGQTLQLRSNATLDFGSNLAFRAGVTIGTVDVNNAGSGTGQTLSLGDVNVSGKTFRVTGGNTFRLGLDNVTIDAGTTTNFETSGVDVNIVGNLSVGVGATLNKIGGNQLFLNADNSSTAVGTINLRAGTLTGTVAGSLGSGPINVGLEAPDSNGFFSAASRLNINAAGALANTTGTDVTVFLGGAADLNVTPAAGDIFDIRAGGRIQGNAAQLGALTAGENLILNSDAIISHEAPGALTGTVASLPNNASYFYGLANTANTLPNIGVNTPWKGVLADNSARTVQGVNTTTPAVLNVEGGDGLSDTIEAYVGGMFGQRLNLGTTAGGDGEFKWNSVSGQKVTIGVRGFGGEYRPRARSRW